MTKIVINGDSVKIMFSQPLFVPPPNSQSNCQDPCFKWNWSHSYLHRYRLNGEIKVVCLVGKKAD